MDLVVLTPRSFYSDPTQAHFTRGAGQQDLPHLARALQIQGLRWISIAGEPPPKKDHWL